MTFSIVGYDPIEKEWGVAVQSKFLGVGAVVPYAKAGVGAVATQSFANTSYGPRGCDLMAKGYSAQEAIDDLVKNDPDRAMRQVGMVDADGRPGTFTGEACYDWAGGKLGKHYAAQGNILVNAETVEAMGDMFEKAEGSLAERLLAALDAGQEAGGDSRGKQSAALLIVKEQGGYGGYNDRLLDLRVDDHPEPIKELIRLHQLHSLYFSKPLDEDIMPLEGDVKQSVTEALHQLNYLERADEVPEDVFYKALTAYYHTENFEERELTKGKIDMAVVRFMENQSTI